MENQQNQNHQNMHTGSIPQQMNHGGHEVLDVGEVLSGAIGTMNTYTLLKDHVQDQELRGILDRQYQFMQQEYNTTVDCFKTGQDPQVPTQSYKMQQNNDFIYGLQPSQPKKPIQSANELTDECISGLMLGAVKSSASMKAVAACETTNPVVRRVLADSIPNCIEMAYEISLYQNKHHYYQVPQFSQQDMQQMLNAYAPAQGTMQPPNNYMTH
ncbi:spore coat protein [Heyndrickxia sporothermodurans]|uniref:Spore coat protein n=1 Tax=Heyndrickxia sporothermodurans TaxID=46224 RepID=A0AB37H9E9_9BACI|nr:spore coat protein [Heyndrickxia sporothermodurans]MBL5767421.1 spore coat protein [Heyndrickxia sporothermodurans]MBL5770771.1 spore coat protein [Heyndrickxia sporothermodurans]MBL5774533.1 spore coat protein [Heyndrickxia sporothermodurans]MBL5777894.1 spore coat protein [Heyndrickxia sporothermodurans]MBL5783127.1 spore coat protein [Heyndrickxia sporothermodurans]